MSQSRQLAAIMFTDIVGYTALMGSDEQKAFAILRRNREIQQPLIKQYNGIWIKEIGDATLSSFPAVTDAILCAQAIQQSCNRVPGLQLRIGIHQGEVVFEKGDVFGDGVNIASRLQTSAPAGGTLISEAVYMNIKNKPGINADFLGEKMLKNVAEPVKVYLVKIEGSEIPEPTIDFAVKTKNEKRQLLNPKKGVFFLLGLVLLFAIGLFFYFKSQQKSNISEADSSASPDNSIAVLPFENLSNDPEQEYFANGMMDEVLNHLFKIGGWRIVSRTSAMAYRGSKKSAKEIAKELGVANLLEGSVQKQGQQIRITVQLINGKTDEHLWSETYDKEYKDVFAIQSDIAQKVAAELKVKIDPAVKKRIQARPTQNTGAYTLYLQAKNPSGPEKKLLEKAIVLDPNFADPYAELAYYWLLQGTWTGNLRREEVLKMAMPLLQKALQLNPELASAHYYMANLQLWYNWNINAAEKEYQTLLRLYPSNPEISSEFADYFVAAGKFEEMLEFAIHSLNNDKNYWGNWTELAFAYYFNNQPEKALQTLKAAEALFPTESYIGVLAVRLYGYTNKFEEVIAAFNRIDSAAPYKFHPHNLAHLAIAYYKTGQTAQAETFLKKLKEISRNTIVGSPSHYSAAVYTTMDKKELAIQWLEKAFRDHEVEMYKLKVEPLFRPLHKVSEFQDIVNRIGSPN